jgi:RNase P subunit RPR2
MSPRPTHHAVKEPTCPSCKTFTVEVVPGAVVVSNGRGPVVAVRCVLCGKCWKTANRAMVRRVDQRTRGAA